MSGAHALAVAGRVCDTGAAGRRGGTGRGVGLDLEPLLPQGLGEVVVHGHADGHRLGVGALVRRAQAPLEVFLHPVVVAAVRGHCNPAEEDTVGWSIVFVKMAKLWGHGHMDRFVWVECYFGEREGLT